MSQSEHLELAQRLRFSLKQLVVFLSVAEHQSVSLAAQQLLMTQSAVSMALAQLEQGLGQSLFDRHGKRLRLNHWGRWLRPRAHRVLAESQHIAQGFAGQQLISGDLAIGASMTIAEYVLPPLILELDQRYPQLRSSLQVANTEQVVAGLLDYRLDLGMIEGSCDDSRLIQQHWCEDELVVVAGPQHPLTQHQQVNFSHLSRARWVLRESGSGTREAFAHAIHGRISKLKLWREYSHVPTIVALVSGGQYLSCLPLRSVTSALNSGELVVLNTPQLSIKRAFSFVWHKEASSNPLRECVIELAQEAVASEGVGSE